MILKQTNSLLLLGTMASSGPSFLSATNATNPDSLRHGEHDTSLNELLENSLRDYGFKQLVQAILASIPAFFDAQQTFISVFTDAEPKWHCTNHTTLSTDTNVSCRSSSNICDLPKSAWAWDGPSSMTTISELGLECRSSIISGLPSSSFFVGCLVGGFLLATLGDSKWLGRKKLLFSSCLAMSMTAFCTVFSSNVWIYAALRFVTGFFRVSIMTLSLILVMETVGKRWRSQVALIAFLCFSFGLLSLPAIAYVSRGTSWRYLFLWTSVPGILYCLIAYFLVNESPRWLFIHGREADAFAVLNRLSSTRIDQCSLLSYDALLVKVQDNDINLYSAMKELLVRRWALKRTVRAMAIGTGIGMAYYALELGVGNLDFDLYLSVTLNGLLDIPVYFLTFILIEKCNRRSTSIGFCTLGGACSIICGVACVVGSNDDNIWRKVFQLGTELGSLFSVCVVFSVLLIYTTELFPTTVRSSATSMVRQAIMFGAVLSPILVSVGRNNDFWCYGVLGLVVIFSGFLVLWLPETRGLAMCDTMEEQEELLNCLVS